MSKRSRHGNDFAPSTFPFLAVLLCVIGALVLLLVINVTSSRASAKKVVQDELSEAIEQAKEQSDYMVSISEELKARRELVKKEIDSRRGELTRTEDHITRLEAQLKDAIERLEALKAADTASIDAEEKRSEIQKLQEQIQQEKQKLAENIESRKDQPPAFSIIPYDGANRTTRRPVYLECTEEGVLIQPEGILISMEDLGPPHGPGNPLDAALRVLRTAYQARDGVYGITIPPYPLLIVRPTGIHSYALARAAMSGWDDQFGYELIDEQMQLAFPEGVPELKSELAKTLAIAKERQRALVAALPARFSRNPFATKSDDTWDSIDAQSKSEASRTANDKANPKNLAVDDSSQNGRRWEMIQQLPTNPNASSAQSRQGDSQTLAGNTSQSQLPIGSMDPTAGTLIGETQLGPFQTGQSQVGPSQTGPSQAGQSQAGQSQADSITSMLENPQSIAGSGFANGAEGIGSATESMGTESQGSLTGSSSGQSSSSSRFSEASSGSSGGSTSLDPSQEDPQMQQAIKEQGLKDQAARESKGSTSTKQKSQSGQASASQRSDAGTGELKPISLSAGKDWATSRMDNKSTPVSRPIRIIVLQDRWLMCREGQDWKYDAEIPLEQGPQAASQDLQQAIRERVESWGLSLPGGHWVPSLTVCAASDAEQSVQRLQRLLEGSGVIIRVQPLVTPKTTK